MRRRNRSLRRVLIQCAAVVCVFSAAAQDIDFSNADMETLVRAAQREGDTDARRARKAAAREEVKSRGAPALRFLVDHMHIRNIHIHILADQARNAMPDAEVVPILLEGTRSPHERTRKLCTYLLGFHEAPADTSRLFELLDDDEAAGAAVRTLGKWKVQAAVPAILPFLDDEDERRRVLAVNALKDIGDPAALPALVAAFDDPVFTVRNTAVHAVASFAAAGEATVRAALSSASPRAARLALRALGEAKATNALPLVAGYLDADDWGLRGEAVRALRAIDPEGAAPWLQGISSNDHPFVRAGLRVHGE